jgi:hypothetical protein
LKRFVVYDQEAPIGYGVEFEDGKVIYRAPTPKGDDLTLHSTPEHWATYLRSTVEAQKTQDIAIEYQDEDAERTDHALPGAFVAVMNGLQSQPLRA